LKTTEKKKKGDDKKKGVAKERTIEQMMPIPRPTQTNEEIRAQIKALADQCQKKDLDYAAEIKAKTKPGSTGLARGWSFPKEDQIKKTWADWNVLFETQTDLVKSIEDHFEDAFKRKEAEIEADQKELGIDA